MKANHWFPKSPTEFLPRKTGRKWEMHCQLLDESASLAANTEYKALLFTGIVLLKMELSFLQS
jgi:hypothetical protein